MNARSPVRRLRRAPLWAAVLLAAACGRAPSSADSDNDSDRAAATASTEASDFSVYDLDARWRDQEGRERTLASLAGKVRVISMTYTHCAHTCPLIVAELKRIEAALSPEERERVGFVLVSLDPRRDTPDRLAEFAASVRLDPARWTLLTGSEESVRELAALLAIRYRPEGETEFSHSNTYLVLDAKGRVVHRRDGLGGGVDDPLAHIRAAARQP